MRARAGFAAALLAVGLGFGASSTASATAPAEQVAVTLTCQGGHVVLQTARQSDLWAKLQSFGSSSEVTVRGRRLDIAAVWNGKFGAHAEAKINGHTVAYRLRLCP